jgi:nitronate monooxygenase
LVLIPIGFLPCAYDISPNSPQLATIASGLQECRAILGTPASDPVGVGISFLTGHPSIAHFSETVLPLVKQHKPAAVWLFAPKPKDEASTHGDIIRALRTLDPAPKVVVQVGNVSAAREAVRDGADVLVCQGIDAGGHQFKRGLGVVSFVPEARAMLDEFPGRRVGILAAGGIVNGKGAAAAMALGKYRLVAGLGIYTLEKR